MRDRLFYSICFGFLFGVLGRSLIFVNLYFVLLFGALAFFVILFFRFISRREWGIVAGFFLLFIILGVLRFYTAEVLPFHVYDKSIGMKIMTTGEIVDEPDIRENNQKLTVEENKDGIATRFLVTAGLEQDFKYGDKVSIEGRLEKPENFLTDQGKVFDYVNYLRKDGIFYIIGYPKIEIISRGNGNMMKTALFSAKEKFLEKMNFVIPEPENLLMGGLILGEKSAFSEELRQNFVDTGTIHIVALSGYNITIVAEWFMKIFSFLPHLASIWAGMFAVLFFVLMTGASSTAIRAGIMAALALFARATGRNYDVARALLLAGVIMVIINPLILPYDVSFQLSFLATVAVIFLAPRIEKYFFWLPERFGLRDIVSVTTAAYIFVFPFILYKMGNFSLVALPANVLILPFIPFTMALGFITGALGLVWYVLAVPLGYIAHLFLNYELGVVGILSDLPFASFSFPYFPLWLTLLVYTWFIYRLFWKNIRLFFSEPL